MKSMIKIMVGFGAICYMAYGAYAENVTLSTFYPSPFGDYQDLTVRGTLTSVNQTVTNLTVNGNSQFNGNTITTGTATTTGAVTAGSFALAGAGGTGTLQTTCNASGCWAYGVYSA